MSAGNCPHCGGDGWLNRDKWGRRIDSGIHQNVYLCAICFGDGELPVSRWRRILFGFLARRGLIKVI